MLHGEQQGAFRSSLHVNGASMEPAIPAGSVVRLVQPEGLPNKGQVILYEDGSGRLVLHRCVARYWWGGWRVVTAGDASDVPDPAILVKQVVAVAPDVPRGGRLGLRDVICARITRAHARRHNAA